MSVEILRVIFIETLIYIFKSFVFLEPTTVNAVIVLAVNVHSVIFKIFAVRELILSQILIIFQLIDCVSRFCQRNEVFRIVLILTRYILAFGLKLLSCFFKALCTSVKNFLSAIFSKIFKGVVLFHCFEDIVKGHIGVNELTACGTFRVVRNPSNAFGIFVYIELVDVRGDFIGIENRVFYRRYSRLKLG